ncbi:MAG: hypothetical protein EXX96DRAFT_551232 [Benjaminiella poitrasii]|nr:MAG: hypothetical protein EXX96DRAFT_551232 [Benjaminiella poitrasii]
MTFCVFDNFSSLLLTLIVYNLFSSSFSIAYDRSQKERYCKHLLDLFFFVFIIKSTSSTGILTSFTLRQALGSRYKSNGSIHQVRINIVSIKIGRRRLQDNFRTVESF